MASTDTSTYSTGEEREAPAGPVSRAVDQKPPWGPIEKLDHDRLLEEQQRTLSTERREYSVAARILFRLMDRLYGEPRTLEKFRVLELIARVPYQAWEHVAYVALTHTARHRHLARRVFDRVRGARFEQDNEQWHLLILEELTADESSRFLRSRVVPQVIAFAYYHLSWLLYVVNPAWSHRLNADFEDHAEHEYALLVQEHPEWESTPYEGDFVDEFGRFDSLADLFRQISYDERLHKEESELTIDDARFG